MPTDSGIYIFGSYGLSDITFFRGQDVLTGTQRDALVTFFDDLKPTEQGWNKRIAALDEHHRGFQVYIRKAFDQKILTTTTELNYFAHSDRDAIEAEVISFLRAL